MEEIYNPPNLSLKTGEGATRVTPASTASDGSSTQQQPDDKKSPATEKAQETTVKSTPYDSAVTISTNLSNLEAGVTITASYLGVDGQDRPLIVSETGTYVVKYDPSLQKDMAKIPPHAVLEVKILKLDREIEARLTYPDPSGQKTPLSIPVTLELIGLGNAPPKIRASADQNPLPLEQQKISYQTTDLLRAENIAVESANKLKEMPLPATTTNYTLYEQATPQPTSPVIIRSSIAGNALIAQEMAVKSTSENPAQVTSPPSAEAVKVKPDPLTVNLERLLHKNTLATVIKNIPNVAGQLPDIVQRQLGATGPLDHLKGGDNFTLRISSIAIPDIRPDGQAETKTTTPMAAASPPPPQINTGQDTAIRPQELSGIVIAPGKNILQNAMPAPAAPAARYPVQYVQGSAPQPGRGVAFQTIYVATPVSVIKIQSPVALTPGTVINFSLPDPKIAPEPNEMAKVTAKEGTDNSRTTATAPAAQTTGSQVASPPASLAAQPLEQLARNWQALNQIITALPAAGNIAVAQSLDGRIPNINNPAQMTSTMVFFLAAMGAKNPARVWLGPAVSQQLEKAGQGKLLNMLGNDMRRIFRLGTDTPVNEWRPALLPLQVGGEVGAVPILTRQVVDEEADRRNNSGEDDDADKNTTRFIVELSLSQFGQIQVDGLLKEKKLNIIIRSKIILPSEMKNKMSAMFTTALEISGYTGDLQFQDNTIADLSVQNIINQKIHMFRS
ncbi:Transcriptional regulator, GntR family domain / Aspartate aminotransferase [hydrothermal vent metagenome]|uniref:Transcriptional regulator, GntR family domain / Aspartate aminotransferase n=1 Tax=hydrothermal vent metagenome TaxID=652676 RepID=A0A3B0RYR5_9ZZZZ